MPAFAILAATTATIASSLTAAGLSTAAATAGANLIVGGGLSVISSLALAPKAPGVGGGYKTTITQADAWRVRGYGYAQLSGVRAFLRSKQGRLYQVIMIHQGQISRFRNIYLGDIKLALDGEGRATNGALTHDGAYYVTIDTRLGEYDSSAYPRLVDDFPDDWSEQHKLNSVATVYALFRAPGLKRFSKVFPEGANSPIRVVADLTEIHDLRDGVTRWTRNAALCIRNYLRSSDGYRLSPDMLGTESWKAFADRCDERVRRRSGDEERYALGGVYSLGDAPKDVLARLLATCDGELYHDAEGKLGIRGGAWSEPTLTLTEEHILSHSLAQGNDRFASFNRLWVQYTAPGQDYKTVELIAWEDAENQALIGLKEEKLSLDMVQSAGQAKRLGRVYAAKRNPRWVGSISTTLYGLLAYSASDENPDNGRIIRVRLPELGIDGTFWVESCGIRGDLSGVEFQLRSLEESAYGVSEADDPDDPATLPDDVAPEDIPIPVISDLDVFDDDRLRVTAEDPDYDGLELDAQWRREGGSYWDQMTTLTGQPLVATAGPIAAGTTYEARVRWITPAGDASDWSDPSSVTA